MCLSIPSKIKSIDIEMNTCVVDTMGVERSASLDLIDELHGIVLPSGAVIRTRYVPNNECNTGCGDINTQTVNVEFIRTEYL